MDTAVVQRALIARGYDLGKGGPSKKGDDGIVGPKTRTALSLFQEAAGLAVTGRIDAATIAALSATKPPSPSLIQRGVIDPAWMPAAKMERIIVHWTAGPHKATSLDRSHYHLIVEGDGSLVRGNTAISANAAPIRGAYAAHTLNCNTGSIGVSLACMAGAVESPFKAGTHPMTQTQWDRLPHVLAALCARYGIAVTPRTVLSHAEVQGTLGIKQKGKWDIARLAFDPGVIGAKACGDIFRARATELLTAIA